MIELWDLYDGERNRTCNVISRNSPIPNGLFHISVSVWIRNSKGQYLISQRHSQKTYPLYWECTGGSITSGEDSLAGAVREVKEELGIYLNPLGGKIIYQTCRTKTQDFYDVWLFFKDLDIKEICLQDKEVIDAKWVDRGELVKMYNDGKLHPLIDYINILP